MEWLLLPLPPAGHKSCSAPVLGWPQISQILLCSWMRSAGTSPSQRRQTMIPLGVPELPLLARSVRMSRSMDRFERAAWSSTGLLAAGKRMSTDLLLRMRDAVRVEE